MEIHVSGEVLYGNEWIRVDTDGELLEYRKKKSLCCLNNVDGDSMVNITVDNKYINCKKYYLSAYNTENMFINQVAGIEKILKNNTMTIFSNFNGPDNVSIKFKKEEED